MYVHCCKGSDGLCIGKKSQDSPTHFSYKLQHQCADLQFVVFIDVKINDQLATVHTSAVELFSSQHTPCACTSFCLVPRVPYGICWHSCDIIMQPSGFTSQLCQQIPIWHKEKPGNNRFVAVSIATLYISFYPKSTILR